MKTVKPGDLRPHDPDATTTYALDLSDDVNEALGQRIFSATWTTRPTGLTVDSYAILGPSTLRFRISGGVIGQTYQVRTLADTNTQPMARYARSFYLRCEQR